MLSYRLGDAARPRGHALLYFTDADDANAVWGTYLVVPPITLDLGKYMPAAFAGQLAAQMSGQGPTAYPLPPMPEKIEGGLAELERLANLRGDDLLDGGVMRMTDPWQVLQPVTDIGAQYAQSSISYGEAMKSSQLPTAPPSPPLQPSGPELEPASSKESERDVDDLLMQVMPERERISRLARMVGSLRYAVGGGDTALVDETVADMQRVGKHLADKFKVSDLIVAARSTDESAGELAQLYVDRCYKLADEDYAALPAIEQRITDLRGQSSSNP